MNTIDACLSPELLKLYPAENKIIVIIDVFRAGSSICCALENNVLFVKTTGTIEDAYKLKDKGYIIAGERDGYPLENFDMGNSPADFLKPELKNSPLVISTTNGTQAVEAAKKLGDSNLIIIGCFLNFKALMQFIIDKKMDVLVLCAGWKNRISIEDVFFAGKMIEYLTIHSDYTKNSDAAAIASSVYLQGKNNSYQYFLDNSAVIQTKIHFLQNDIEFCLQESILNVVPILKNDNFISNF